MVRLQQVKEATVGCFLECSGMRSRVSEGGTRERDEMVYVRAEGFCMNIYHVDISRDSITEQSSEMRQRYTLVH